MKNIILFIIIIYLFLFTTNVESVEVNKNNNTVIISIVDDINLFCEYQFDSIIVLHHLNDNHQNKDCYIEITKKLNVVSAEKIIAYYIIVSDSINMIDDSNNKIYLLSYLKWLVELTGEYVQQPVLLDAITELTGEKKDSRQHQQLQKIKKQYYIDNRIAMSIFFGLGPEKSNAEFGHGINTGGIFELGFGAEKSKIALDFTISYQISTLDENHIWNIPRIPDSLLFPDNNHTTKISANIVLNYNFYKYKKIKIYNSIGYSWNHIEIDRYEIMGFNTNNIIYGLKFNYNLGGSSSLHKSSHLFGLVKIEGVDRIIGYWYVNLNVEPYDYNKYNLGSGRRISITTGLKFNFK